MFYRILALFHLEIWFILGTSILWPYGLYSPQEYKYLYYDLKLLSDMAANLTAYLYVTVRSTSWRSPSEDWRLRSKRWRPSWKNWKMNCRQLKMPSFVWRSTCRPWRLSLRGTSRDEMRWERRRRDSSSNRLDAYDVIVPTTALD